MLPLPVLRDNQFSEGGLSVSDCGCFLRFIYLFIFILYDFGNVLEAEGGSEV